MIQMYRDQERKWRWRFVATNGRTLADSAEGYTRRIDCTKSARQVVGTEVQIVVTL